MRTRCDIRRSSRCIEQLRHQLDCTACIAEVTQFFNNVSKDRGTTTYLGPAMSGDRADALDDTETLCVGECYFGYEYCTRKVYPTLAFRRLANAKK